MKHISKRVLLLLLTALLLAQTLAVAAAAAPTAGVDGTVDILRWERVDSQDDLPDGSGSSYPVLLLYESGGNQYMVDCQNVNEMEWQSSGYSGWKYKLCPTETADGVRYGEKTFRTLDNVGHMYMVSTGRKDDDNGNAKVFQFTDSSSGQYRIEWMDEYLIDTDEQTEYSYVTVLTPNTISDVSLSAGRVGLFANISWSRDCLVRINSDGCVVSERSKSWDMGKFVMYIGYKETLSCVRHDYTIGSGSVANYNGYIYIQPGVTLTVETGGVLSISGTLYNNGAIKSTGGDIVVQQGATIEQFCLDDKSGGTIECDAGDLVILSGGRVATGKSSDNALGYGNGGFVLKNGATCTNFGTLVTGSSAYLLSGAALDNRSGGTVLVGYTLKPADSGNFSTLSSSQAQSPDSYDSIAENDDTHVYTSGLLCGGTDAVISNNGSIYLSSWMQQLTGATGITGMGSGKINAPTWAHMASAGGMWSAPTAWQSMITL